MKKGEERAKSTRVSNLGSDWVLPSEEKIEAMTDEQRAELLHDVSRRMTDGTIAYRKNNAEYACALGRILIIQKSKLAHGEWMPWVTKHTSFSLRQIERWTDIARTWKTEERKASSKLTTAAALDMSQRAFVAMRKPHKAGEEPETKRKKERERKKREERLGPHDLAEFKATLTSDLHHLRELIRNPQSEKQLEELFLIIEEIYQEWDSMRERIAKKAASKKRA